MKGRYGGFPVCGDRVISRWKISQIETYQIDLTTHATGKSIAYLRVIGLNKGDMVQQVCLLQTVPRAGDGTFLDIHGEDFSGITGLFRQEFRIQTISCGGINCPVARFQERQPSIMGDFRQWLTGIHLRKQGINRLG